MSDTLATTGQAGAVPPPNAPQEISQPLLAGAGAIPAAVNPRTGESYATEDWHLMSPIDRARHNERELKPLTFEGPKEGGVAESVDAAANNQLDPFYQRLKDEKAAGTAAPTTIRRVRRAPRPLVPADPLAPTDLTGAGIPDDGLAVTSGPDDGYRGQPREPQVKPPMANGLDPVDLRRMPAASDTDSPTRGIPRQVVDAGKQPQGGFGDQAAAQYFALNGQELRVLVEALMDQIYQRIQNDLRFNEAIVYPQVGARVVIEITGFAHDSDFLVEKIMPPDPRARTPTEIARQFADEVAFVVLAEHRETDDQGNPATPPDAVRVELGLLRPAKRVIRSGGTDMFVDVVP